MKLIDNIFKIALLLGAIFLFKAASAQDDFLELLPGSERFIYNEKTGVHRLIGTVNFKYQGNTMYCDSAHYHELEKLIYAYGNVHVLKEEVNLYCDSLFYNGNFELAKLWSNVRVLDDEYELTTDTLDYDSGKKVGIYRYGGVIEKLVENEMLSSKVGYIYTESKNMFFRNNVEYISSSLKVITDTLQFKYNQNKALFFGPSYITTFDDSSKIETTIYTEKGWYNTKTEEAELEKNASILTKENVIKGDYLYSNPEKGVSVGKGNVYFEDTTQHLIFSGEYFFSNDSTKQVLLTEKALVRSVSKKDTLYIHADTLFAFKDSLDEFKEIKGYYNVLFFKQDLQGQCDSMFYDRVGGKMELFEKPIVWAKGNSELKGDFMEVFFKDDSVIQKMNIIGNSTVLLEVDSGNYYNQIGGKSIITYFDNNNVVRTDVNGNARTVFFPENKDSETDSSVIIKRLGMNRIYASDLRIYLDSNEVKGVTYFDKPDGVFYPIEKLNKEEQFIKGFEWKIAIRPKNWKELIE